MTAVTVRGTEDVRRMLAPYTDPELNKRVKRGLRKGGNALKRPLQSALRPVSGRMASAVWVHVAKRERPGIIVGHRKRKAFFWHMIIGGTRPHSLRPRKQRGLRKLYGRYPYVRGIRPHPIVQEVADRSGHLALMAFTAEVTRER